MSRREKYLRKEGYIKPYDESPPGVDLPEGWCCGGVEHTGGGIYSRIWRTWTIGAGRQRDREYKVAYGASLPSVALEEYRWDGGKGCYQYWRTLLIEDTEKSTSTAHLAAAERLLKLTAAFGGTPTGATETGSATSCEHDSRTSPQILVTFQAETPSDAPTYLPLCIEVGEGLYVAEEGDQLAPGENGRAFHEFVSQVTPEEAVDEAEKVVESATAFDDIPFAKFRRETDTVSVEISFER
jgi:hypothetical protein